MIQFLKKLLGFSSASRNRRELLEIADRDPLTRFLFSDKLFARTSGRVKRQAFAPPENLRLSVFQIVDLQDEEIWTLGHHAVGVSRGESPRARADIEAIEIRNQSLQVTPSSSPPRHANVVGWPLEKEKIRVITLELAAHARLKLPPA